MQGRALPALALALAALGLSAAACGGEEAKQVPGEEQPQPTPSEPLSSAQIAGVASVLNMGEIQQAQTALPKLKNAEVRAFAQMMINEHGAAEKKLTALLEQKQLAKADSALSAHLQQTGQTMAQRLRDAQMTPNDYDALYLDVQIFMHRSALEAIDRQLLPQAKDADLAAQLTEMRGSVAAHLARATTLRRLFPALERSLL
jgi:putative membrane protein